MNRLQKKLAKATKKKLDVTNKTKEFSTMLDNAKTYGDYEKVFDMIDALPSWYATKKDLKKSL